MRVPLLLLLALGSIAMPARAAAQHAPDASCMVTPFRYGAHPGGASIPQDIPWFAATPKSSHIYGILFFAHPGLTGQAAYPHVDGNAPGGGSDKILWYVTRQTPHAIVKISGRNMTVPDTMRDTASTVGSGYPSILDVSTPGCWRLTVRNGKNKGHFTLDVLP